VICTGDIDINYDRLTNYNAVEQYHKVPISWFSVSVSQRPWQPVAEVNQSGPPCQQTDELATSGLLLPVDGNSPKTQRKSDAGNTLSV